MISQLCYNIYACLLKAGCDGLDMSVAGLSKGERILKVMKSVWNFKAIMVTSSLSSPAFSKEYY